MYVLLYFLNESTNLTCDLGHSFKFMPNQHVTFCRSVNILGITCEAQFQQLANMIKYCYISINWIKLDIYLNRYISFFILDLCLFFFAYNLDLLSILHCFFIFVFVLIFLVRFISFSFILLFFIFFHLLLFNLFYFIFTTNTNPNFWKSNDLSKLCASQLSLLKLCKNTQLLSLAICKFQERLFKEIKV